MEEINEDVEINEGAEINEEIEEINKIKPVATLLFDEEDPLDVVMVVSLNGLVKIPYNKHMPAATVAEYLKSVEKTPNLILLNGNGNVTEEYAKHFTMYDNVVVYPFTETKTIEHEKTKIGFFEPLEFGTALGFSLSFVQSYVIADILLGKYPNIEPSKFGLTNRDNSKFLIEGIKSQFPNYIVGFDAIINNMSGLQIYEDCLNIGKHAEPLQKQYAAYLCRLRVLNTSKVIAVSVSGKKYNTIILNANDLIDETFVELEKFAQQQKEIAYLMIFRHIPAKLDDKTLTDGILVHVRKCTSSSDVLTLLQLPDTETLYPGAKVTGTGNQSEYWFTNKDARTKFAFFR